ncbi:MAG TPA: hypothetical protein VG797_05890, partial [Phycisphaerales bacterium]|nr:hypothetical protein [Phycisphaerales bacterium]
IETDALDAETIRDIEQVLIRHRHSLERVAKPRQKLEDLFVNIVERARDEQVATSGARHDGRTASFLLGDQAEGGELIENLIRATDEPVAASAPVPVQSRPGRAGPDEALIDQLLSASAQQPASIPEQPRPPAPQRKAADADRAMIDSLIDDSSGKPQDRAT